MMRFPHLSLAVMLAASAHAQSGDLRGLIRAAGDGAPLPGTEISLAGTKTDETGGAFAEMVRSGPDGRFFFTGLPLGEYVLGIRKSGYEAGVRVSRSVEIEADGDRVNVQIDLRRSAAVSGRVVDPDGDAVPDAAVFAAEWDTARGRRVLRQIEVGRTDDRGEFRLHGLRAGPYVIGVHPLQLPAPAGVLAFDLAPQYYPNAASAAAASPVRLGWGDERSDLGFQLEWSAETVLEGFVQNVDGAACDECVITGSTDDHPTPLIVGVTRQGLFAVRGAPAGSYRLLAQRRRDRVYDHAEVVLVAGSPERIGLRLTEGLTVTGRLAFDKEPETPAESPPVVELLPALQGFGVRALRTRADEAGAFVIDDVPPGRYVVALRQQPPEAYLDQVLVGGAPAPRSEITAGTGSALADVQLRLKTDGGTIDGRVVVDSGGAAPDGFAVLLPASYETGTPELTASYRQSDGMIRFTGVPPGRYHLFAVARENHFDLGDAEDRVHLRREGRALRIAARQTIQFDAPFIDDR